MTEVEKYKNESEQLEVALYRVESLEQLTTFQNEEVSSLITTIESQKEEIEKFREFGKVTVQWYKDQGHPITAINAQAKLDWISYTSTLCEIEKQANAFTQEGEK
jgi:hypothetical protein